MGELTVQVWTDRGGQKPALVVHRGDSYELFVDLEERSATWPGDDIMQDVRDAVDALWDELTEVGFTLDNHPAPHALFLPCPTCDKEPYVWCTHLRTGQRIKYAHKARWL